MISSSPTSFNLFREEFDCNWAYFISSNLASRSVAKVSSILLLTDASAFSGA